MASTARHARVPTENTVYMTIENGGAGQIIVQVKPTETGKKSHLLKGYNLEVFYEILAQNAAAPNASQLTEHEVYSKSHFVMNLGATYSGQKLHIAALWRHKTNPALNGGLCAIQAITIS